MSRCALCGEHLDLNGGWVHANGSPFGEDGHLVVPISERTWQFLAMRGVVSIV